MKHVAWLSLAAAALTAANTQAARIHLGTGDQSTPGSGEGSVETWLANLVLDYNNSNPVLDPDLPAPGNQLFGVNQGDPAPAGFPTFGDDVTSISIPTGAFDYVVFHWGGQGGGNYEAFYIGSIGGAPSNPEVFDTTVTTRGGGLSWYRLYHYTPNDPRIPDSGTSLALLGAGLLGLAAFRRQR